MLTSPAQESMTISQVSTHPKKVVVIGDSLVYGFGDPEGGGWVERLRRRSLSPATTYPVIYNLGVRGDGVPQVAQRLASEFSYRGELRNRVPDVLVLSIGVNDSAQAGRRGGRNFTPFDEFHQTLDSLLVQAKSLCPVLFVGMIPVNEAAMPFAEVLYYSHEQQRRYKQATHQLCQTHQIPYLDIFEQWLARGEHWWQSQLSTDGLHPNILGHQALLEDVISWEPFQQITDLK
ncbi:MAG: GDSL-type esterase/lipase family protein [Cyanobacteria bacterium J06635_15]